MFNIGPEKLMMVLFIALIVLGPDKLPNAARQIGKYLNEFRRISQGFQNELRSAMDMADVRSDPTTSTSVTSGDADPDPDPEPDPEVEPGPTLAPAAAALTEPEPTETTPVVAPTTQAEPIETAPVVVPTVPAEPTPVEASTNGTASEEVTAPGPDDEPSIDIEIPALIWELDSNNAGPA
jgi:sec-independent protein translocase protein TatB